VGVSAWLSVMGAIINVRKRGSAKKFLNADLRNIDILV
jgi:hypothetical protein